MYYILKEEATKKIIGKAREKAGDMKKLSKELKIAKSAFYLYLRKERPFSEIKLNKIVNYADMKIKEEDIEKTLPDNWKQIKGGVNCVKIKKRNGTFEEQLQLCHRKSSTYMKRFHKTMKKESPEKYYKEQYEKFKKVGGYKFVTKNGEKVRNKLELETANKLKELGFNYEYEPYINFEGNCFFPDFIVNNNVLIECTMWRGYDKAIKLKKKIDALKNKYKIYVLIPKALNNYYKMVDNHVIYDLHEMTL